MKAYCEKCAHIIDCEPCNTRVEAITIRNVRIEAPQQYGTCPICGDEVYANAMITFNVMQAHDAYRRKVGSITSSEIKCLLEKYAIGAQPLSRLLGWGENTLERQMKHTIPDREHARRLFELQNDPAKMKQLLIQRRDMITETAYRKAMEATNALIASTANGQVCWIANLTSPYRALTEGKGHVNEVISGSVSLLYQR